MSYTFDEMRNIFCDRERFSIEPLSKEPPATNPHLELMLDFKNNTSRSLTCYFKAHYKKTVDGMEIRRWEKPIGDKSWELTSEAYEENLRNEVRIYLVIDNCARKEKKTIFGNLGKSDKKTRKILFYFGMCNGSVVDPPPKTESPHEDKLVHLIVKNYVYHLEKVKRELEPLRLRLGTTTFEKIYNIRANKEIRALSDQLQSDFWQIFNTRKRIQEEQRRIERQIFSAIRKVYDQEHIERIEKVAEFYKDTYEDRKILTKEDRDRSGLVEKTYPAVLLTHFVKNDNYSAVDLGFEKDGLAFKMGDFVFWEVILEKLKEIRELSGLTYVYLFAAERFQGGNPLDEESEDLIAFEKKQPLPEISLKLLAYYRRHYNFQFLNKRIDKQQYDFGCYTMLQTLENMERYKELIWDSNRSSH